MTAVYVALVGLIGLSSLLTVAQIGKPRESITPGVAVGTLILNSLVIWGITVLWQGAV